MVVPAYAFGPLCPEAPLTQPWPDTRRRLAVFTSTRAVDFGLRQLPAHFLDDVQIAAIGPSTAAALERADLRVSLVPEGRFTSESLLAIPGLGRDPGRALIFTAPGGRKYLQQGLAGMGWDVSVVYVYQRENLKPGDKEIEALLQAGGIISVWTSENAMRVLAEALPPAVWSRVVRGTGVATSPRLQRGLEKLGFQRVVVARGPDNASIGDCVQQLI